VPGLLAAKNESTTHLLHFHSQTHNIERVY
jgi:hypothetical protein